MVELDTDLVNQIAAAVRYGEWPERALVRLGVPAVEGKRWLSAGRERDQEGVSPDGDLCVKLVRDIDVAEADCERTWLESAKVAAASGRRNAEFTGWMTLLERRFPERYCVRGSQNRRKEGGAEESFEEALARLQQDR